MSFFRFQINILLENSDKIGLQRFVGKFIQLKFKSKLNFNSTAFFAWGRASNRAIVLCKQICIKRGKQIVNRSRESLREKE
jgi:hypothetical protein